MHSSFNKKTIQSEYCQLCIPGYSELPVCAEDPPQHPGAGDRVWWGDGGVPSGTGKRGVE